MSAQPQEPDDESRSMEVRGSDFEEGFEPPVRGRAPEGDDPRRCTASKSDGSGRCGRWAIEGHHVCPNHGGSVPRTKARAQLTLLDLLPLATSKHRQILETSTDERVILKATEMVYDRTGLEKASARDNKIVREAIVAKILDIRGEVPEDQPLPPQTDEDIVDAEIVEDQPYAGDGTDLL